jgi:hypothetical protein
MTGKAKKIESQLPAKPYEPTQRDRDAVRAQVDRNQKDPPPPKVKFVWHEEDRVYGFCLDHPDPLPASLLLNQAIGAKDEAFGRGLVSQMASIAVTSERCTMGGDCNSMADAMNFMISMVKGLETKDTLEAALAVQMASVHLMTMRICNQLAGAITPDGVGHAERALNKLARTFAAQVETLKKYRTGGEQKVTVQHVTVSDSAQAIVGNVSTGGGCDKKKSAGGGALKK